MSPSLSPHLRRVGLSPGRRGAARGKRGRARRATARGNCGRARARVAVMAAAEIVYCRRARAGGAGWCGGGSGGGATSSGGEGGGNATTAGAWAWAWAAAVAAAVNPARAAGRWRWLRSGSDLQPTLVTRTAQGTAILAQAGTTVAGFEWPRARFESATMDASLHGGTERRIVETTASWRKLCTRAPVVSLCNVLDTARVSVEVRVARARGSTQERGRSALRPTTRTRRLVLRARESGSGERR